MYRRSDTVLEYLMVRARAEFWNTSTSKAPYLTRSLPLGPAGAGFAAGSVPAACAANLMGSGTHPREAEGGDEENRDPGASRPPQSPTALARHEQAFSY
jgi:hypothetical protein